jgi:hypothetical protein
MTYLEDHGLSLAQLKERRRELIGSLAGCRNIDAALIAVIAALQYAITAIDPVALDLDDKMVAAPPTSRLQVRAASPFTFH